MLVYPKMNPVAFSIGPLHVHWYGLMYLLSFALIWALASYRLRSLEDSWSSDKVADLIFYGAVGVIVGGRLGNMIFWDLPHFIRAPWSVFQLWDGGMSFHGGLLGVIVATSIFCSRYRMNLWDVLDFAAPMIPIGLGLGRLGNFINGELWGTVANVPWAMVFPRAGLLPRHPSQLYEFFCEGVLLFVILWWYSRRPRPRFAVCAMFSFCYGCFRFFLEFFRQPDPQYGYLAFGWLTMGQILSMPMIIVGGVALARLSLKAR